VIEGNEKRKVFQIRRPADKGSSKRKVGAKDR